MNGCRGTVYEEGNNVTTLQPGADFDVKWIIQAPHPGTMKLSIVKPSKDSAGKITYENYKTIKTVDPFAQNGGEDGTTATMPTDVTGCDSAGDCALQFYWHSDIANQTYPTCADIIVSGSGGASTTTKVTTAPTTSSETSNAGSETTEQSADGSSDQTTPATNTSPPPHQQIHLLLLELHRRRQQRLLKLRRLHLPILPLVPPLPSPQLLVNPIRASALAVCVAIRLKIVLS